MRDTEPPSLSELHPDKAPPDRGNIVYISCIFIGTASLMPFNVLVAAADYIGHHFGHDNEIGRLLPLCNIANLLSIGFMIFIGRKMSFWSRMVILQTFVAITIFSMPFIYHVFYPNELNMLDTKYLTFVITSILGAAAGIFTSTVTAYAALLINPKYIQITVACMTWSAIIPDTIRCVKYCKFALSFLKK